MQRFFLSPGNCSLQGNSLRNRTLTNLSTFCSTEHEKKKVNGESEQLSKTGHGGPPPLRQQRLGCCRRGLLRCSKPKRRVLRQAPVTAATARCCPCRRRSRQGGSLREGPASAGPGTPERPLPPEARGRAPPRAFVCPRRAGRGGAAPGRQCAVCAGPTPIGRAPPVPMMSCGWNAPRGGPGRAARLICSAWLRSARAGCVLPRRGRRCPPLRAPPTRSSPPAPARGQAGTGASGTSRARAVGAGRCSPGQRHGARRESRRRGAGPPGADNAPAPAASFPRGAAGDSAVPGPAARASSPGRHLAGRAGDPPSPPPPEAAKPGAASRPAPAGPVQTKPGRAPRRSPHAQYLVLDLSGEPVGGPLVEVGHVGGLPAAWGRWSQALAAPG